MAKGVGVNGLLLAVGLLLAACSVSEGSGPLAVGDAAPPFTLTNDAGREVSLQDLISRRPTLLYFHMAYG